MKILLDECLPKRLKASLQMFEVRTTTEMGWKSLRNGKLMEAAIEKEFDILLTIDKNLEYQHNLSNYNITIVVFDVPRNKIEFILPLIPEFIDQVPNFDKRKSYRLK